MKQIKCPVCDEKFTKLEGLHDHIDEDHSDLIPEGFTPQQYVYYTKTGKTHGNCVICKNETEWNETTGKYKRFCDNPKCKEEYREIFKKRMVGKYGKTTLLNDPEQQKKMLANRHISGEYEWTDGSIKTYTGSYELDFLKFLDVFMNMDSDDVITPSPHTYYYKYEGETKFYIPDVYIPSLNLEIEIKDGGSNPNMHHKIVEVDKVKERLKDDVMKSQKEIDYIKIVDKKYDGFFDYLMKKKDELAGAKNVKISSLMTEAFSNIIMENVSFDNIVKTDRKYEDGDGVTVVFYDNGKEVGTASTVEYDGKPNAFLHGFEVKPSLRNKGYGTAILKYMIKEYDVSILYVYKHNKSIHLYERFGFKKTGMFNKDMIIMQRKYNSITESYSKGEFYFYHLVDNNVDIDKYGLISPEFMYNHKMYDLYDKSTNKYKDRLCDGWGIYPNRDPKTLTREEIYNGLNTYRGEDGNNHIYFFKYPPYSELGPRMSDILNNKRVIRINIDDPNVKKYIKSIDWGYDGSHSDNRELSRKYYEAISYDKYFKKYDDNSTPLFAPLNHISIIPKNGYLPREILDVAENGQSFVESIITEGAIDYKAAAKSAEITISDELNNILYSAATGGHNIYLATDWHLWIYDDETSTIIRNERTKDIINTYNNIVNDDDVFIYLGDLCDDEFQDKESLQSLLLELRPNTKILCKGNNDIFSDEFYKSCGFTHVTYKFMWEDILFSHFPLDHDYKANIHGHIHGCMRYKCKYNSHIDVYTTNGRPLPILDVLKSLPAYGKRITEVLEEKYIETSISDPFKKSITLYHGSHNPDKLSKISPLSKNMGTRFSNMRMSSFWTPDEDYAKDMAICKYISDKGYHCVFDHDFNFLIYNDKDKNPLSVYKDISNDHIWIYVKNMQTEHIGRGHFPGEPSEYSIDVDVVPDEAIKVELKDIKNYIINKIRFMDIDFDSPEGKKYIEDDRKYWYRRRSVMDLIIYPSLDEYTKRNRELKSLKKPTTENRWLTFEELESYEESYDNIEIEFIEEDNNMIDEAWSDIKNGVNPKSRKRLFHVSKNPDLDGKVLTPRVPEYLVSTGFGKDDPYYEEMKTPRVCFSPSINGCLNAIIAGQSHYIIGNDELYVYVPEKPVSEYKIKTNKNIIKDKDVFDAHTTGEVWVLEPVKLRLYGTIRIDQVSRHHSKYTLNKGAKLAKRTYKWHWQVKPNVIKGMTKDDPDYYTNKESYEPVLEVSNIAKDNDNYYDFERFVNGDSNILIVTGLKASNTTKVAREYSQIYDATYINFDLFTKSTINQILDGTYDGTANAWYINHIRSFAESRLVIDPDNRDHILKPSKSDTVRFVKYIFSNLKDNVKYIIEGLCFYRFLELSDLTNRYPLIIKHDSLRETIKNFKISNTSNIFNIIYDDDIKTIKDWFITEKNRLNDFSKRTLEYRSNINNMNYTKDKYPVYVVLMHSGSALANAIKKVTGDEFSHASISFDPSLRNMYSFGKKYDSNILELGMIREDVQSAFLHRPINFALYVTFVDVDEFKVMKSRFYDFVKREKELRYSFKGLVKYAMGLDAETENKLFCSEFVANVINAKYNNTDGYYASQVKPENFKNFNNFRLVQKGKLSEYDPSVTIARVNKMKK